MSIDAFEELMQQAIDFGSERNPIWPFSSLIVDGSGQSIVKATDCAHISPLYHAESLAVHLLASEVKSSCYGDLTLVTTAEPDAMSMSSIHWANVVHGVGIKQVIYGCSLDKIENIWPFGIQIPAEEIVRKSSNSSINLVGSVLESETLRLFLEAKERQKKINSAHPARGNLPDRLDAFYEIKKPSVHQI